VSATGYHDLTTFSWEHFEPKISHRGVRPATVFEENENGHFIAFVIFTLFPFNLGYNIIIIGTRGSVVGRGTMLQAGRSPVRVPDEVDIFNLPNPSGRTMALGVDSDSNRNDYQESS
jgi:hypothetical protein